MVVLSCRVIGSEGVDFCSMDGIPPRYVRCPDDDAAAMLHAVHSRLAGRRAPGVRRDEVAMNEVVIHELRSLW